MASKRDYETVAEVIRESGTLFSSNTAHVQFAMGMATWLADNNPRFDKVKFIGACMPRWMVGTRMQGVWDRAIREAGE